MNHKSPPIGNEISCVMHGINDNILNNHEYLENTLLDALKQDNFTILNKISHKFKPKGFTVLILLSESHATIHTYPEYNSLAFHIYSCRGPQDAKKAFEFIKEKLEPSLIDFNERAVVVQNDPKA